MRLFLALFASKGVNLNKIADRTKLRLQLIGEPKFSIVRVHGNAEWSPTTLGASCLQGIPMT
jgi:hypothetical protein